MTCAFVNGRLGLRVQFVGMIMTFFHERVPRIRRLSLAGLVRAKERERGGEKEGGEEGTGYGGRIQSIGEPIYLLFLNQGRICLVARMAVWFQLSPQKCHKGGI